MARKLTIALGFDGSSSDDWTAIRAEMADGTHAFQFTPKYVGGRGLSPTYWNPSEWGGQIPRDEVHSAVEQLFEMFDVKRFYCDPRDWQTEIQTWAYTYGEKKVISWPTFQLNRMHPALVRFQTDLSTGLLTHDDCKTTALHIRNSMKVVKPGERYLIGKPHGSYHQKIDLSMASVLCHEAFADLRIDGLGMAKKKRRKRFA